MRILNFTRSPINKKYRVMFVYRKKIYTVDFGNIGEEQYKDLTPLRLYSSLDNNDEKKRIIMKRRLRKIRARGKYTFKNPMYANYWIYNFLY